MRFVLSSVAAGLACLMPVAATAQTTNSESAKAERMRMAMQSARWTGPMLASTAETLPHGHFYTEPYFFDGISDGKHSPGTSGYYQYGLFDNFTVGVQPNFAFGTDTPNRGMALGDVKLLSQIRLTHFTPEHRIPSVALVFNVTLPIGKYDRLGALKQGHGSGSFAPEIGINVQHYFLLKNGRLLRARINVLKSFPLRADVIDRSVYGTAPGFRGHARPGSRTTLIGAVEYSLTREWVLAFDVDGELTNKSRITGRAGSGGPLVNQSIPSSSFISFAPAVEYNWSDRSGILLGVWVIPRGHNTPSSVTPAIAYSRFW